MSTEHTSTFSAFRAARKRIPEGTVGEPERFPMNDADPLDYFRTFEPFMRGTKSLEAFVEDRRRNGLRNVVLDLASSGAAFTKFKESRHDGALAVGISDPRTNAAAMIRYAERDVTPLAGNILTNATWDAIDRWIEERGGKTFDLVFFRPGAGIKYIGVESNDPVRLYRYESHTGALLTLLARVYERLGENGEIFAETDPNRDPDRLAQFERFAEALRSVPGIEAAAAVNADRKHLIFHLTKRPGAPSAFPTVT